MTATSAGTYSWVFTLHDQQLFADLSGDVNPIHLDEQSARRSMFGAVVVHGVHAVLWALEGRVGAGAPPPCAISVKFQRPIFLDEVVHTRFDAAKHSLSIWNDDARLVEIVMQPGEVSDPGLRDDPSSPPLGAPLEPTPDELTDPAPRPLRRRGDGQVAHRAFPALVAALGEDRVRDLAATSEIVGMQVPGLHSLYLSLRADFAPTDTPEATFRVASFNARVRIMHIAVETSALTARIEALVRPSPSRVTRLSDLAIAGLDGELSQVRALIVGGSRGLGEAAAKLIARGGGQSVITYNVGGREAESVVDEIVAGGGQASAAQLDVTGDLSQVASLGTFNALLYFATPRIFGKRGAEHDPALEQRFRDFYVSGLRRLVETLLPSSPRLVVLYPSTVAIDEPLPELAEYIAAKTEGEALCAELSSRPGVDVLVPRLPRTDTDQTMTAMAVAAEDPIDVMLPLVRSIADALRTD